MHAGVKHLEVVWRIFFKLYTGVRDNAWIIAQSMHACISDKST